MKLRDLKPMEMVIAFNRNNVNPRIRNFISSCEPLDPLEEAIDK
jgi:hypothetical protein